MYAVGNGKIWMILMHCRDARLFGASEMARKHHLLFVIEAGMTVWILHHCGAPRASYLIAH